MDVLISIVAFVAESGVDILPIAIFLFLFQRIIIGRRITNARQIVVGFLFVVVGLGLFLDGLELSLFPLGRLMAAQLTDPQFLQQAMGAVAGELDWRSFYWVYMFAAAIGFAATMAEPSLIAIAIKANNVSGGAIGVVGLRVAVAIGVAVGVGLGCFRIVTGLPLHYFIAAGYLAVIVQTIGAPRIIIPLAYDSGGVTTSAVTVPLVAALGIGLAEAVPGRSVLIDGFGLVAFASLFPIIMVLAYGQLAALRGKVSDPSRDAEDDMRKEKDAL